MRSLIFNKDPLLIMIILKRKVYWVHNNSFIEIYAVKLSFYCFLIKVTRESSFTVKLKIVTKTPKVI